LPAEQRDAFLAKAFASDPTLKDALAALLPCIHSAPRHETNTHRVDEEATRDGAARVGQELGAYRLIEFLGSGGMGMVYRAFDPRLSRYVAIKMVKPAICTDPAQHRQLQREARAAARLNHPNIVSIYDIGVAGETTYLVHELLEGYTLRDILRNGRLTAEVAVEYASQIAGGLYAAHERGIIHRDLKPSNVFITRSGLAKILDFGLATLSSITGAGDTTTGSSALTEAGVLLGTPGYMSPEQVRGERIDSRSDIFSLGAILYEMLSGERAFAGDTSMSILLATLLKPPSDLEIDFLLNELIRNCLAKDKESRFQSCADIQFVLTLILRRSERLARTGSVLTRVAVLPVESDSPLEEDLHRCVSATDALALELARLSGVRVISTASVHECQKRRLSLRAIAEAVGADVLVQADMLRSQSRLSFRVAVVDSLGRSIWTETITGEVGDLPGLQTKICEAVRAQIWARFSIRSTATAAPVVRVGRQAHDHYIKGLHHWRKHTAESWLTAIEWFRKSTALDPSFAPAFAGLAHASYAIAALRGGMAIGDYFAIKDATNRALSIDPSLAEAHSIDARLKWTPEWDAAGAEAAFRRSLTLNPSSSEVNTWYAVYLITMGRREEGLNYAEIAVQCDPVSVAAQVRLAVALYNARRYETTIDILEDVLDLEPGLNTAQALLGCAHVAGGAPHKGLEYLRAAAEKGNSVVLAELAWAYARCGDRVRAEDILKQLLAQREHESVPAICIAWCCASLGHRDDALRWLKTAVRERCLELIGVACDPIFDDLRGDVSFLRIIASIGIPSGPRS
jgi:serine/threonine protein kinase/tetratricopeptide (TPR) repeat protein